MNSKNNQSEINIGIDTGKHQLDIYIRPLDIFFSVTNDEKGIKESINIIKQHKPTRIIIEATGRLEHAFIFACSKHKLPFVVDVVLSRRKFAKSLIDHHHWLVGKGGAKASFKGEYIRSFVVELLFESFFTISNLLFYIDKPKV